MPRCFNCRKKFESKRFLQKTCENPECEKLFREGVLEKSKNTPIKPKNKPLEKKCKGSGRAIGFGCGEVVTERIFGLGKSCRCYSQWLLNSDSGAEYLKRVTLTTSNKLFNVRRIESVKQKTKDTIALMSKDEYRAKVLQPNINKIARFIDYGQKCIATNNFGKMAGGHRISVGANRSTSLNLHNIHIQSFASNSWKGGDNIKYDIGIKTIYGEDYLEFLNSLHQTPKLDLTKDDMIETNKVALRICLELSKNKIVRTPQQRIELRNQYNLELNIYQSNYSIFK